MKRYVNTLGKKLEVPEVDSFLADIKAVCEKHKMWIGADDDYYENPCIRGGPSDYLDYIADYRETPERLAISQAEWDKEAAEKAELKRKVEAGEATQSKQHEYAMQCCMERMSESTRGSTLIGWDKVIEGGPWEKADKGVSYPQFVKVEPTTEDVPLIMKAYESLAASVESILGGDPGLSSVARYEGGHHTSMYGGSHLDNLTLPEFIEFATNRVSEDLNRSLDVCASFVTKCQTGSSAYVIIDGIFVTTFNKKCE